MISFSILDVSYFLLDFTNYDYYPSLWNEIVPVFNSWPYCWFDSGHYKTTEYQVKFLQR
jgi:hypothetical protein